LLSQEVEAKNRCGEDDIGATGGMWV